MRDYLSRSGDDDAGGDWPACWRKAENLWRHTEAGFRQIGEIREFLREWASSPPCHRSPFSSDESQWIALLFSGGVLLEQEQKILEPCIDHSIHKKVSGDDLRAEARLPTPALVGVWYSVLLVVVPTDALCRPADH